MSFASDLRAYAEKTKVDLGRFTRRVALQVEASCVGLSPVDTGRFRANWFVGIGSPYRVTVETTDKDGGATIQRAANALGSWTPGDTIWISNSLPYAERLEYGWSGQAPQGMVRLTVQQFNDFISKAVGDTR